MKILLLAPQPFYSERGTPIAIRNLARVLGESGHEVDILTYPDGDDIDLENTRIFRVWKIPFLKPAPVGFSATKILYDFLMLWAALFRVLRTRYDVVHAVEEAVYIGIACRAIRRFQLVYDMDSSMADQILEKWPKLRSIGRPLYAMEKLAVKRSHRTIAVCQALVDQAQGYDPAANVDILEDAVMEQETSPDGVIECLREEVSPDSQILLYVGNLEHYQGVDLVVEALACPDMPPSVVFVVIGGNQEDIQRCRNLSHRLSVDDRTVFLGPKPVGHLMGYLKQADILVSPRTKGVNTPMKIYSYLGAGIPIVATNIPSHSQVLDASNSCLVDVTAQSIARGVARTAMNREYREGIAARSLEDARDKYSGDAYRRKLLAIYEKIGTDIA